MKKFKQLLAYITELNLVADEQLSCFITECQMQISGKKEAVGSLVAGYVMYEAVYEISNYKGDATRILTHFTSWVYNNNQSDTNEQLEEPNFDIEPVDDNTVDVMVSLPFSEKVYLSEDPNGEYLFGDKRYSDTPPEIDTAETVEVAGEAVNDG